MMTVKLKDRNMDKIIMQHNRMEWNKVCIKHNIKDIQIKIK